MTLLSRVRGRSGTALGLSMLALLASQSAWAAEDTDAEDIGGKTSDGRDIIVLGKSYGQEVGKTVTPLKDIPNTVTLINRDQIEQQNLFTLEDALTATVGITVTGVGSEGADFMSRGFAINNYLVDGTPTLAFASPAVVPDLFFYERLEVLRGPAGLFSGSGNPAGSINMVRKRPLDTLKVQGSVGYGTYQNFRAEADVSTPIGGGAAVRFGAMIHDQDQFYDIAHRNRLSVFGVGKIDIGEKTMFTVGVNYERFKPAIQTGLPGLAGGADGSEGQLLNVRRSTYLGADWNRFQSDTWSAFAELTHQVSDRWSLRASGVYTDIKRIDIYSYIGNGAITAANAGLTNHIAYRGDNFATTKSLDFNAVGSFPAFGRDHTLILGTDYQASDYTNYYTRLSGYARINVYNPVSPAEPPLNPYGPSVYYPVQGSGATCPNTSVAITPAPTNCVLQAYGATTTQVEQYGMYGQIRFKLLDSLTLTGGGRMTWWSTHNRTLLPTAGIRTGYNIDGRFTPYAGIVWDATDNLNFYASYADSFTPQAAPAGRSRPDGQQVQPLMGSQYEGGTKLSLMHDKLLLSAAVYQIEQTNRLFNDPDLPTVVLQIGKVRARGIEAEAAGQILPGWRINGGYSFTKTKYLSDANPVFEGLSLVPIIPEHSVKAFTNYAPEIGPLRGFSIGGGFTWFSSTWGGTPTAYNANGTVRTISTVVRQKAYAVADLRAGYKINDRISLSVNVNNLFDKTYYARISSTGRGNFYASPRTVFGTLRVSFP